MGQVYDIHDKQLFDNQYLSKMNPESKKALDIYTDLVGQITASARTRLHLMRRKSSEYKTVTEINEDRRPRVSFCGHAVAPYDSLSVNVVKGRNGKIFYNGLSQCAAYWRCPTCALKISEFRHRELYAITQNWLDESDQHHISFVTLTMRHSLGVPLFAYMDVLLKEYRNFQQSRFMKDLRKSDFLYGQVKTLENTWSPRNGWHPHLHLLYFHKTKHIDNIPLIHDEIIERWHSRKRIKGSKAANKAMLVSDVRDLSKYVSKWDITAEMSKSNVKTAKGLTPFGILQRLTYGNLDRRDLVRYDALYNEYVNSTFGRHHLHVSSSLKEYAEDIDKSDLEIVHESDIDEILFKIGIDVWKHIAKHNLQPLIISAFEHKKLQGVLELLEGFEFSQDLHFGLNGQKLILQQ
jgi:hypothetical protein